MSDPTKLASALAISKAQFERNKSRGLLEREARRLASQPDYTQGEAGLEEAISPVDFASPQIMRGVIKHVGEPIKAITQAGLRRTASNLIVPHTYTFDPTVHMYQNMKLALRTDNPNIEIAKGVARAILKDQPIWRDATLKKMGFNPSNISNAYTDTRRWLLRKGLGGNDPVPPGLIPTRVKNVYSFNPRSEFVSQLAYADYNPIMGNFTKKIGTKGISYFDNWNFKINEGEAKEIWDRARRMGWKNQLVGNENKKQLAVLPLRWSVDKIMDPVRLAGHIPYNLWGR